MCSRYQPGDIEEIRSSFRTERLPNKLPEIKALIFPGYVAPIVLNVEGELALEVRMWGLKYNIPGKRDPKVMLEKLAQNAVSETISEKRTFKNAWHKNQRCIIPAKSFLEPISKQFRAISDPSRDVLSIAGIWEETTYKGEARAAFTMLTCEPNKFMEPHHDRMPVILEVQDIDEWLSVDTTPDEAIKLCRPYAGNLKINS